MNKKIKISFILSLMLVFLSGSILFAQKDPNNTLDSTKSEFDIKTNSYYKVVLAFYTTKTDTIALLGEIYQESFTLIFLNNQDNDSTEIVIEVDTSGLFLAGKMIYLSSLEFEDNHIDIFSGNIISVVKKELQPVEFEIDRFYPIKKEDKIYYRLLIFYADQSVLQFIFY